MTRLELFDVTLRIGSRTLIQHLSLRVDGGQNWALLGANGSGKTTLVHALAGLRTVDHGKIFLDGRDVRAIPPRERARRLGILFQQQATPFPATVLETVLTGRHPWLGRWQNEEREDHEIAMAALGAVGMESLAGRSIQTLSGGERRRVEIATLLAQRTPVALFDEPVNHLDPHYQTALLKLIVRRSADGNHLNLVVLHDVNLALRFCSHGLLILPDGFRAGPIDEIIEPSTLQSVYGCPMTEVRDHGQRWFFVE